MQSRSMILLGCLLLTGALWLGLTRHGSVAGAAGAPPAAPAASDDWSLYGHDPSRTNDNPAETQIRADNLDQLIPQWQAHIGLGTVPAFSAPTIAGGRVFVSSSTGQGDNFFAFDAQLGARLCSAFVGYNPGTCLGVGIGATAAVSGTVVVTGGGDAAYYGLDVRTGAQLWRNALDVGPSGFAWTSPLLANDRAYLGVASDCDNPSVRGELRAVDLATGVQLANTYFVPPGDVGAGVWNSATLSPDGQIVVVVTGEDNGYNGPYTRSIVSLDAQTLEPLESDQEGTPDQDDDWGTTPIIFHDSLGRTLVGAVHKNGIFYAYELNNIAAGPVWQKSTGNRVGMMPAYDPGAGDGGTLFIAGQDDSWQVVLYAVDPATGKDRWAPTLVGVLNGNLAVADGLIFANLDRFNDQPSMLKVLDEKTGATLRTIIPDQEGNTYSGPVVANGMVYWVSGEYLNAWGLSPTPLPTTTPAPPLPSATPSPSRTPRPLPSGTPPAIGTPGTPPATVTPNSPPATATPSSPPATATPCVPNFSDVQAADYFYMPVQYLACRGAISGYGDGTFRPYATTTRAQMVKIVVLGFALPLVSPAGSGYTFADVPPGAPFFDAVETAAARNVVTGYACGGPDEPCDAQQRPYFRPNAPITRGQLAKLDALAAGWPLAFALAPTFADVLPDTAFYAYVEAAACHAVIAGYSCGGVNEPCDAQGRPYFRPAASATRGQISKIVYLSITGPGACSARTGTP